MLQTPHRGFQQDQHLFLGFRGGHFHARSLPMQTKIWFSHLSLFLFHLTPYSILPHNIQCPKSSFSFLIFKFTLKGTTKDSYIRAKTPIKEFTIQILQKKNITLSPSENICSPNTDLKRFQCLPSSFGCFLQQLLSNPPLSRLRYLIHSKQLDVVLVKYTRCVFICMDFFIVCSPQ